MWRSIIFHPNDNSIIRVAKAIVENFLLLLAPLTLEFRSEWVVICRDINLCDGRRVNFKAALVGGCGEAVCRIVGFYQCSCLFETNSKRISQKSVSAFTVKPVYDLLLNSRPENLLKAFPLSNIIRTLKITSTKSSSFGC